MAGFREEPCFFSGHDSVQACIRPQNAGYLSSRHWLATREIGGILMIMLGVIGEYIWRICDNLKDFPPYIIESTSMARPDDPSISRSGDGTVMAYLGTEKIRD
jgi:hypothetical protein